MFGGARDRWAPWRFIREHIESNGLQFSEMSPGPETQVDTVTRGR